MGGALSLMAGVADSGARIVSYSTTGNTSQSTTLVITKPSGIVNGDLLVAVLGGTVSWTQPAGWTEVVDTAGVTLSYRVADGSEGATLTYTHSSSEYLAGAILVIRGGTYDATGTVGSSANPAVAPSVTLSAAGLIIASYVATSAISVGTYTAPTGFSESCSATATFFGIGRCKVQIFFKKFAAGASGTVSATNSSTSGRGVLLGAKNS